MKVIKRLVIIVSNTRREMRLTKQMLAMQASGFVSKKSNRFTSKKTLFLILLTEKNKGKT